jgi:hypothetical protein
MPGAAAPANPKATWSLVLGIVSVVLCLCPITGIAGGIAAIVLAGQAKRASAASGQEGAGMATAGLVLGIIGLIAGVVVLILNIVAVATGGFHMSFNNY